MLLVHVPTLKHLLLTTTLNFCCACTFSNLTPAFFVVIRRTLIESPPHSRVYPTPTSPQSIFTAYLIPRDSYPVLAYHRKNVKTSLSAV